MSTEIKKTDNAAADARLIQNSVALTTLGCKANQYDTSAIEDSIIEAGFTLVDFASPAGTYIINTCTVTNRTDSQSRTLIRRVRRTNPLSTVIVTGCYASVSPEEIAQMDGVDYVVGNTGKESLVDYIKLGRNSTAGTKSAGEKTEELEHSTGKGTPITLRTKSASKRTRATLKIQDGCSKACSYCIIPKARGTSRSIGFDTLVTEIEAFMRAGYKEVVLTGIHLGDYAGSISNNPEQREAADITSVAKVIKEKAWKCRFRFSSLDPDEVTDDFIEILRTSDNICKHVHLPLQSGDDGILKRMNRQYSVARFTDRVLKLSAIEGISIGTDIITGFPGESIEAFEATYRTLKELPINYLHIFPYSVRAGTPAATYPGALHGNEIKSRAAKLKELDSIKRKDFFEANLNSVTEVLIESVNTVNGVTVGTGKTSNYINVTVTGAAMKPNTLVDVRLTTVTEDLKGMAGRLFFKNEKNPSTPNNEQPENKEKGITDRC